MPITTIQYNETKIVSSIIQSEILGDCIVRSQDIRIQLEKGMEPTNVVSRYSLKKYLSSQELFAYDIAVRTGDTFMSKKLSNVALSRSKSQRKAS